MHIKRLNAIKATPLQRNNTLANFFFPFVNKMVVVALAKGQGIAIGYKHNFRSVLEKLSSASGLKTKIY